MNTDLYDLNSHIAPLPRMHLRRDDHGTSIEFFGHKELDRDFKHGEPWRRMLLRGKTAHDYLRLVEGKLSKLELTVRHHPPGKQPELTAAEQKAANPLLEGSFAEIEAKEPPVYRSSVWLDLRVDSLTPELDGQTISMGSLVRSTARSDEFDIFTCSCGSSGCAGIGRGIEVVHEDGLVVWRVRGVRPRRVVVFEREQYRQAVFSKVREALTLHKQFGSTGELGAADRTEGLEEALCSAEAD